jgi:putative nucleotidyltransferase with HDIG domain
MKKTPLLPILRVVLLYVVFATLWILLSDRALVALVKNPYTLTVFQTYKGIFFVLMSATLIYALLSRELKLREKTWEEFDRERNNMLETISTARDDARHQADQLARINGFGQQMAETFDITQIYNQLVDAIHAMTPDISAVCLALYNSERQWITCTYTSADGSRRVSDNLTQVPLDAPGFELPREVLQEGRPKVLHDLPTLPINGNLFTGSVPRSVLYLPMLSRDTVVGLLQLQSNLPNRFQKADIDLMTIVANTAGIAIHNATLFEQLQRSHHNLTRAYDATIEGWSRALELRDHDTQGHTLRVASLTIELARRMGCAEEALSHIRRGTLLHDMGKMAIPDSILRKAGPLSNEEWVIMQSHPALAYQMLSPIEYLKPALDIPYCHHERWDGKGYPRGLKGEEIPLPARIFAVVDVWDALRSERSYHLAWPADKVHRYLKEHAGTQFDPLVVDAFINLLNEDAPAKVSQS